MGVEIVIYSYCFICVSMIVFNLIYLYAFRKSDEKLVKYSNVIENKVLYQIENIKNGKDIDKRHFKYLSKRLLRIKGLMAFDATMTRLLTSDVVIVRKYIRDINSVFLYLSVQYLKDSTEKAAYFAYIIAKYKVACNLPFNPIADVMVEYLKSDSIYCRQNAMKALYSFGNEEKVIKAMKTLDKNALFIHEKTYTNGLLSFSGDHKKLIELLWKEFDFFQDQTKVVIMNYVRFKSGDYCERMYAILVDKMQNPELHFSAIRYFGRYYYSLAQTLLHEYAQYTDSSKWNYAAISAIALSNYPSKETLTVLKSALKNANWYVRYNAAQSLEKLGLNYSELIDVMSGDDRYAREMMVYRLESRILKSNNDVG